MKKKKQTLEDLVKFAHSANMHVSIQLIPLPEYQGEWRGKAGEKLDKKLKRKGLQ